ncbi:signal peptidase I [bacterium]|uniref:Signal peptidase I n=1 Tax=Candidatus Scatenecus faecavium TaxID=2840915 RepID=A0A9D1FUF4_9BACT|nr:signal peptidase I [bacterium]HIS82220.1 signal peptidase I [Candidatus Scatenecus faecavium]
MYKIKEFFKTVKEKYNSINPVVREIIETIVFVLVMVIVIRFFVGEIRWIPSASMHPTLLEGDRIVVERYSRFFKTPKRGDIMVFYPPFERLKNTPWRVFSRLTGFFCKDVAYIKRVIGLPGENVKIKPDKQGKYTVYINDKPLNEPYVKSAYDYPQCSETVTCEFQIPEGYYLMLGDNRGNSQDGRYWGLLPEERFIGRAVTVFWPLKRIKRLRSIRQD